MTEVGSVYGESLYELAKDENLTKLIGEQASVLQQALHQEPDFVRLLSSPNLTKAERCQILDDSFRGSVHPYLLNFMKILTEKGYMRHFPHCCTAYRDAYYRDNGILLVEAVTAAPLTEDQLQRLTQKLSAITGKKVELQNRTDPACLGGIRLNYDGKQLDDTLSHRLQSVSNLLKNTVL